MRATWIAIHLMWYGLLFGLLICFVLTGLFVVGYIFLSIL